MNLNDAQQQQQQQQQPTTFTLDNGQTFYQIPQHHLYTPIYQRASNPNMGSNDESVN